MKLVAGLGNPGREYEDTLHNVGFQVVDLLMDKLGMSGFQQKFQSQFCRTLETLDHESILTLL